MGCSYTSLSIIYTVPWKETKKITMLFLSIPFKKTCLNICIRYLSNYIAKAWSAIDRLPVKWESNRSNKIKQHFFQIVAVSILLYRCTTWKIMKRREKKLNGDYTSMLHTVLNKSKSQHSTQTAAVRPLTSHLTNQPNKTNKTCWALSEKQGRTQKRRFLMDSCTWTHPNVGRSAKTYIYDTRCSLERPAK